MEHQYPKRLGRLLFGLVLFSVGGYLSIQANVGLAPWSAFSMGVSGRTGLLYGDVSVITSFVILAIDLCLKEKIGVGTLLDAVLIGKLTDLLLALELMPKMENFWAGVAVLLLGQVVTAIGSYYYIGAALGCGPRDALMVALGKRLKKTPIGLVRMLIEGTALLIGWALGAKVGLGTVISVFGMGTILQVTFQILKFDVKDITHEGLADTWRNLSKKAE